MFLFFFFNDTATTEIYTLSLHDALPISSRRHPMPVHHYRAPTVARTRSSPRRSVTCRPPGTPMTAPEDRKSTRLNSSHANISYAVFCLKKKKKYITMLYHSQ